MGDYFFIVCLTCKAADWWKTEEIPLFMQGHEGHLFSVMDSDTFEERPEFRRWFLKFMDWPVEEAED